MTLLFPAPLLPFLSFLLERVVVTVRVMVVVVVAIGVGVAVAAAVFLELTRTAADAFSDLTRAAADDDAGAVVDNDDDDEDADTRIRDGSPLTWRRSITLFPCLFQTPPHPPHPPTHHTTPTPPTSPHHTHSTPLHHIHPPSPCAMHQTSVVIINNATIGEIGWRVGVCQWRCMGVGCVTHGTDMRKRGFFNSCRALLRTASLIRLCRVITSTSGPHCLAVRHPS